MAPGGGVLTWEHRRVGQQTQGAPGQLAKRQCAGQDCRCDREEAMRIQTPPWLGAGPPPAAASTSRSVG